jgi:thiol-disulfide isomerase/thioredoxin
MRFLVLLFTSFLLTKGYSQSIDSIDAAIEEYIQVSKHFTKDIPGKSFPAFTATGLDGKTYTNENIKGKATFLNFWFESCHPCISEIPMLNRLYNLFKDKPEFQFYAITFETKENAERAVKKYGIEYPVLLVSHSSAQLLNFKAGYPTNMILNKDGKVTSCLTGGFSNPKYGDRLVDKYFKSELEKLLK